MSPNRLADPSTVSLEAGVLLLALDRPALYPLLTTRISQLGAVAVDFGDINNSEYASADGVIRGTRDLTTFLTYGSTTALTRARGHFRRALETTGEPGDVESRWVAAHLLQVADGLETSSVWRVLPPNLPSCSTSHDSRGTHRFCSSGHHKWRF